MKPSRADKSKSLPAAGPSGQSGKGAAGASSSSGGQSSAARQQQRQSPPKQQQRPQQSLPLQQQQLYDYFFVLDFEASCDTSRSFRNEVIEFPIVVLDARSGELVAEFHAYVRPLLNPRLTPFCTQLTGIEQATVDAAEPFPAVFARAQEFYKRFHSQHGAGVRTMFVTCGDWDLQTMLPAQARLSGLQVPSYLQRWINVKVPFRRCLAALGGGASGGGGLGMAGMLEQLGLPLVGRHHSGIDDARNIAYIVRELLRRGQVLDKTTEWSASLKRELG